MTTAQRLLAAIETTTLEDADGWKWIVQQLRLSPTARKKLPRDLRVLLGDRPRRESQLQAKRLAKKMKQTKAKGQDGKSSI